LPFASGSIDAIVANHSLKHFDELAACLAEMGRVTGGRGALYVAVPDASTLTDRLYRWLGDGGGHVNAFVEAAAVARQIEDATGLRHVATRTLCSSLSFLHRDNAPHPRPRRLALLGGGHLWTLHL
jgi:SAM-dependent methyltransferase